MKDDEDSHVVVNISGTKFELSSYTWSAIKSSHSPASKVIEEHLQTSKENNKHEYFFERQAGCFAMVMSYYQNRGLHMPSSVCPAEFKEELDFWGIDSSHMAKCCFSRYVGFFDDQNVLGILEKDQENRKMKKEDLDKKKDLQGWTGWQATVWLFLEEPSSSIAAKIYFYISSLCVVLSIFGLVSGTHRTFIRKLNEDEWREYFGDDFSKYQAHFDGSDLTNTTVPPLPEKPMIQLDFLSYIEYITVAFFTAELIVRVIFCPYKKTFLLSFLNLVDIFALLVMYSIYVVNSVNPKEKYEMTVFDIVHCLQIVRVFRLFRIVKNFNGFRVLLYSVKASAVEVLLMSMFLVVAMLMFGAFAFFSGDTAFLSIPDAFWWAIVTMTTVGYGDVYPTIGLSKLVGGLCAITGVCLLAVIIPIFVNNFLLFYSYSKVWGGKHNKEDKSSTKTSKEFLSSGTLQSTTSSTNKVSPTNTV